MMKCYSVWQGERERLSKRRPIIRDARKINKWRKMLRKYCEVRVWHGLRVNPCMWWLKNRCNYMINHSHPMIHSHNCMKIPLSRWCQRWIGVSDRNETHRSDSRCSHRMKPEVLTKIARQSGDSDPSRHNKLCLSYVTEANSKIVVRSHHEMESSSAELKHKAWLNRLHLPRGQILMTISNRTGLWSKVMNQNNVRSVQPGDSNHSESSERRRARKVTKPHSRRAWMALLNWIWWVSQRRQKWRNECEKVHASNPVINEMELVCKTSS